MPSLSDLIGKPVPALIPSISRQVESYLLHAVDRNGIWVENELITNSVKTAASVPLPGTPIAFVPFSSISYLISFLKKRRKTTLVN